MRFRRLLALLALLVASFARIDAAPPSPAEAPYLSASPSLGLPLGEHGDYYEASPGARLSLELPLAGPFFARCSAGYSLVPLEAGPGLSLAEFEAGGGWAFSPSDFLSLGAYAQGGYYHAFLREEGSPLDGGGAVLAAGVELKAALAPAFVLGLGCAYAAELGLDSGLRLEAGLSIPLGSTLAERPARSGEGMFRPLALRDEGGGSSVSTLLSLRSGLALPLGESGDYFEAGPFALLSAGFPLPLPGLSFLAELSYQGSPLEAGPLLTTVGTRAGLGESLGILPGFGLQLRASGGWSYSFVREDEEAIRGGSASGAAGAGLSLSPSPSLLLGLDAEYAFEAGLQSSLRLSLGATVLLGGGGGDPALLRPSPLVGAASDGGLAVEPLELEAVYPVFRKFYDANPVGAILVKNEGTTPLKNLRAAFFVRQYMDLPKESPALAELGPGQSAELPLFALFTDRILEATEATLASAEAVVECESGGKRLAASRSGSLRVLDRNALTWREDRGAAAFVTPRDPAVMGFAKNVASLVSGGEFRALDRELAFGMAVHEALRSLGVSYNVDPKSSYAELSRTEDAVDYLQFPRQTLEYRAGDCDDLSILYCALLESLGVETAFITVPGHIFMAFALPGTGVEAARRHQRPEDLALEGGRAWIPVEVTMRGAGFLEAWQAGAKQWREAKARDLARLYPLREAWTSFEPVALPGSSAPSALKAEETLERFRAEARRFVERELSPQVARLQAEAAKAQGSPKPLNALGVLYARYGLVDKAEAEFRRALAKGDYAPALVNLGNLAFLAGRAPEAEPFYAKAYAAAPKDPGVLLGLARVNYELENYGLAKRAFDELKRVDPALAGRYAYLELRGEEATRAADAVRAKEAVEWHE